MPTLDSFDASESSDAFDLGTLEGVFSYRRAIRWIELPLVDMFYADKEVHKKLRDKKFDLVFAESMYVFGK